MSDATCWDFKVHRDRFQLSQSLSLSWKSALVYHGWAQSRPCVACSKKHRGVAGSCTLARGFEYSHTSVTCHHGWFYTRKRRCSQGLLISVREWRETLTGTDTSVEDLQLPNPRSTRFRVLMSDLWRPKATHKYVHTHCWHPRNFKLRALRNALEMETWDQTTSSRKTYSQDSQGNKDGLQRKTESNFWTRKHLLQLCSLQIRRSSNRINDQLLLYLTVVSFLLNGPNSFQLLIAQLVADRCG